MKNIQIVLITLLITTLSFAQNGINYKAIIKDNNGNVVSNSAIQLQLSILEDATTVYVETHTLNTNQNGLIVTNIGEGSTVSGTFTNINWSNGNHFLNIKVDSGNGLIDLGTTQFMSVPYALSAEIAKNVTGLEAIDEGNGIGYRIIGRDTIYTGIIGKYAVDLSYPFSPLFGDDGYGATGNYSTALGFLTRATGISSMATGYSSKSTGIFSTAIGFNTEASGDRSTSMGANTIASGEFSTAFGVYTTASGSNSTAMGYYSVANGTYSTVIGNRAIAPSYGETTIGTHNTEYTPTSATIFNQNDRLFVIGNGSSSGNKSNALTVLKNGDIGVVTDNPKARIHISEGNDTGLGNNNGFLLLGEINGNNISIDNNEIMAKNNGAAADLNLQLEGGNVKIGGTVHIGDETIRDAGNNALRINAALLPDIDNTNVLGNPSQRWTTVYATNGTINTSDRREKKNIKNLHYGLAEVLQIQPVSFNWKNTNNPDTKLGLIAQDLQELIPEVVKSHVWEIDEISGALTKKELERLGVYYSDLVPVLINAIKEQHLEIERLKKALEKQETMEERIASLEEKISN